MKNAYKLIFNPHSGKKWWAVGHKKTSLEEMKAALAQYQIQVDEYPTKSADDAYVLAKNSIREGYKTVLVAGGDGTIGEVANGLIGSEVTMGILPFGSYMNIAKMLSVPRDLEKAVQLIKIGRTRKIDVGCITSVGGKKLQKPHYFIESIGMGIEAELQQHMLSFEHGDYKALGRMLSSLFYYYNFPAEISMDETTLRTKATLLSIANGPYTGASFVIAPDAKLNDHRLTVALYYMNKFELFNYFFQLAALKKGWKRKIKLYQAKDVTITTKKPRLIHADARVFGETPISCSVLPNALTVITGFPTSEESSLMKRTYLDP